MLPTDLLAFQSHLQALVAGGDTRRAIGDLLEWTSARRPGRRREALALSADFEQLRRDEAKGILSFEETNRRRSQINDRLLQLTEQLADAPPGALSHFLQKHWKKLAVAVPVALGVLASVAEFTGYSVRDFFEEKTPAETAAPSPAQPPVDIHTSGDQSPAVNAPGGEVIINYGDGEKSGGKKPKKDSLSQK